MWKIQLAATRQLALQYEFRRQASEAADESERLTLNQYRAGTVGFTLTSLLRRPLPRSPREWRSRQIVAPAAGDGDCAHPGVRRRLDSNLRGSSVTRIV